MENSTPFYKRPSDFAYMGAIIGLMIVETIIIKFSLSNYSRFSHEATLISTVFNTLLGLCLYALFLKKYNPDGIRKLFMGIFLLELVIGIALKKLLIHSTNEIIVTGLLGVLFVWLNTHSNREKFVVEVVEEKKV